MTSSVRRSPVNHSEGYYHYWGKRALDLLISIPLLILLAPFGLIAGVLIRWEDGGPAIFIQERVGARDSRFTLRKFRTMPLDTEEMPSAQAGQLRVTRIGRILRRTSLDEIPQLLSVLNGDMSIVGPRPALPSQVALLRLRDKLGTTEVRPGLTGLAQVKSYDGMPEEEKARWDGEYAQQVSLKKDAAILVRTIAYLTRKPPQY